MRKKILLVLPEMSYTGAPESTLNMALVIQKMGYYVTVCTISDGPKKKEFIKQGLYVMIWGNDIEEKIKNKKIEFDLVIVNTSMLAYIAKKIQDYIPTILFIREAKSLIEFADIFSTKIEDINDVNEVYCVSEYAQEWILSITGRKAKVLHNYIPDVTLENRLTHNIKDKIHFGIIGTIEERKGIDIAIKAFQCLDEEVQKKCELKIVGRILEWQREYWEPLMKNIQLTNHIIYLGEIKEKKKVYEFINSLDVVIVASRDESCSLVVLESAMLGKAIIVNSNIGAKYMVSKKNGYICENNTVDSLKEGIMDIYNNRRKIKQMGMYSKKQYRRLASEQIYYKKLKKIIEENMKVNIYMSNNGD